jgi:hypothetical protein
MRCLMCFYEQFRESHEVTLESGEAHKRLSSLRWIWFELLRNLIKATGTAMQFRISEPSSNKNR